MMDKKKMKRNENDERSMNNQPMPGCREEGTRRRNDLFQET